MSAPERIWTNFREANRLYIAYDEPPRHPDDDCKDAYILVTAHEAAVAAARKEGMELAAKVCDRRAGNASDFDRYTRRAAGMCASDIRAEASK